jgi:fructosamine-3-kinase
LSCWPDIEHDIGAAIGRAFRIRERSAVTGGSINSAWNVSGSGARYLVKVNRAERAVIFESEAAGLEELARAAILRVPRTITYGENGEASWIVLQWLELTRRTSESDAALGRQLARLHRVTAERFGWKRDNTIGSNAQPNGWAADWIAFWQERRLGFQLDLARRKGYEGTLQTRGRALAENVRHFFPGYRPAPSLLHGDLWSGNAASDLSGAPVVFDPAVYYGDREADIAMTELFGGFSSAFYAAYREAFPLDIGYAVRKNLYNLYHVLNHLNIFGGAYLRQAERMIEELLAEIG